VLDRVPTPKLNMPSVNMPSVKLPKLDSKSALESISKTAGDVAQKSQRVGRVAGEVQDASDAIRKATK
jgi:hypothetical protein